MEGTKKNIALLILDMQVGILNHYPAAAELTAVTAQAIAMAKAEGIMVIYSVVGFRPEAPEMNHLNKQFNNRERFANTDMDAFTKIHPALGFKRNDLVVIKRRVSAFTGTDLEILLRSAGVSHIVLAGITTGGVVLSTLREAADNDYQITVLKDACADTDPEVHQILIDKVFPRQADVLNLADWSPDK